MIHENEVVMLLFAGSILFVVAAYRRRLARFPAWKTLLAAFGGLFGASVFTVVEGFFSEEGLLNVLQHLCFAVSCVLLAAWTFQVFRLRKE